MFSSFYSYIRTLCFCIFFYNVFLFSCHKFWGNIFFGNYTLYFPGHNILHMDFHFDDHWVYWVDFEEGKHNGVYRIHPDGTERQHVIMVSLSGTSGSGSGMGKKIMIRIPGLDCKALFHICYRSASLSIHQNKMTHLAKCSLFFHIYFNWTFLCE